MNQFSNRHYIKKETALLNNATLTVWESKQAVDHQWDAFLDNTPYGHFYQSSMWAQVRILDGWQPLITVITLNDQIVGGFQILWRAKSYLGKIGLLLKGPVIASDDPQIINFVISSLKKITIKNKINALVIQTPDRDQNTPVNLKQAGFCDCYLDYGIKDNTVIIDLNRGEESILKSMKHNKRKNIKTATREGVHVREGNATDIGTFFNYMTETCKRQQVKPSPSDIKFIETMWDLFSNGGNIKLFLSVYQERDISSLMVILFAHTAYLWKFGWSGESGLCRPNEILYFEIFKWAKANNYRSVDMGSINSKIAQKILTNQPLSEDMTKSYSFFKAGFGGNILPLSGGLVFIPNPIVRMAYKLLGPYMNRSPRLKKRLLT